MPNTPGTALAQINVYGNQDYKLWLGGSFSRGFEVSVDGHLLGRVKDELLSIGGYAPVADVYLTPGVHMFALTYPHADLTPGSGDNQQTSLAAISLQPLQAPRADAAHGRPGAGPQPVWALARLDRARRAARLRHRASDA